MSPWIELAFAIGAGLAGIVSGYQAGMARVRREKPEPERCPCCGRLPSEPPLPEYEFEQAEVPTRRSSRKMKAARKRSEWEG